MALTANPQSGRMGPSPVVSDVSAWAFGQEAGRRRLIMVERGGGTSQRPTAHYGGNASPIRPDRGEGLGLHPAPYRPVWPPRRSVLSRGRQGYRRRHDRGRRRWGVLPLLPRPLWDMRVSRLWAFSPAAIRGAVALTAEHVNGAPASETVACCCMMPPKVDWIAVRTGLGLVAAE